MRKQDQLVHLIHSLSPAEKKFFREYTAKNKTGQSYIKLYEALQKADTYDAASLCKKLKKTKANLAHEKDYLQEVLFKVLRDGHAAHAQVKANNDLNNIILLYQKGLYEMAIDFINKSIREALKIRDLELVLRLYALQRNVVGDMYTPGPEKFDKWDESIAGTELAFAEMQHLLALDKIEIRLARLWNQSVKTRSAEENSELQNILDSDILNKPASSPNIQALQAGIIGALYGMLGHKERSVEFKLKQMDIMEQYPMETHTNEQNYVVVVANAFAAMYNAHKVKEAEAFLHKIQSRYYRKLPLDQAFLDKAFDDHHITNMMILYQPLFRTGDKTKEDVVHLLHQFEKSVTSRQHKVMATIKTLPYFMAAKLAFVIEDYQTCHRWLDTLIDPGAKDSARDAQTAGRIALSIVHYQFGSYTVSKSLAASAANFIKKTRPLTGSEKAILRLLSNAWRMSSEKEMRKAFQQLDTELETLRKTPVEENTQKLFYYDEWIKRNLK